MLFRNVVRAGAGSTALMLALANAALAADAPSAAASISTLSANVPAVDAQSVQTDVDAIALPGVLHTRPAVSDPCGDSTRLLASLNRPTVGYSTCTVPSGSAILEEGYQITTTGGAAPSVATAFMQGFQRYGLSNRLEIDLVGPTYNRTRDSSGTVSGFADLGVGTKYQLPQRTKVAYAFDALLTGATGTKAFTAGGATEQLNFDAAYPLSDSIGLGTTLGFAATKGALTTAATSAPTYANYGSFIPSVVVTDQLNHLTQIYLEGVDQTKIAPDLGGRAYADAGIQRLLGQYIEVDFEYGMSFTPVQGSRFRYFGFGIGLWNK